MSKRSTVLLISGALILGILIGQMSIASAHGGDTSLIHACVNDYSGTLKIVLADSECSEGWHNLDWSILGPPGPKGEQGDPGPAGPQGEQGEPGPAGDGVKTISGIVNADGTPNGVTPNGFTVIKVATGVYQINFPAGSWASFPVMTVTPFGVFGAYGNPVVSSVLGFGDGSAQFTIHMVTSSDQTLFDNAFMFIATASLP